MKFLVDECLSPALATWAREAGHEASTHVRWLGLAGIQDWNLMPVIVEGDWTFVTRNAVDFRGPASAPGSKGLYTAADLHAGLICLNLGFGSTLDDQLDFFAVAVQAAGDLPDLINQCLEVSLLEDDTFGVERYPLPKEG